MFSTQTKMHAVVKIQQKGIAKTDKQENSRISFGSFKINDLLFFKDFIYLCLERGEGKEKESERNINVWLPLVRPPLETQPTTQACALTGNQTSDPLVTGPFSNH